MKYKDLLPKHLFNNGFAKKICFLTCILVSSLVTAQNDDSSSSKDDEKLFRDFAFIPLPVLASNPANGFMYGLAPSASWRMGDEENTSISSLVASIIYTTKKQWILTFKTNVFLDNDNWNLLGDWRYFITSQPTYGLGTGPNSSKLVSDGFEYDDGLYSSKITEAQLMAFDFFRFHETVLRRFEGSRFFAGIGYHLDRHYNIDDKLLDLDNNPQSITSHYAYSQEYGFNPTQYTLSGLSFNGLLDSRNNTINPTSGRYAFLSFRVNPKFLGSDKNSTMLWAEYRDYFGVQKDRPRNLIGVWAYGSFITSGEVPYLDLPALGWDQFGRSGRAYPQGRFRGQGVMYLETEYRFPLQRNKELLGGVLFVNSTTATNKDADIDMFQYINLGYGLGLRIMLNKKSTANLAVDYAWGDYGAQGFYLSINEVF